MAAVPLAVDERVPDEQLARQRGVDLAVRDEAVGDQRHAVQRHPLVRHHGRALLAPVRLAVAALDQVRAEALGPLGLDRGVLAGPQAAGLDELAGHQELRVLPVQPAAREDREPGAAGAEVLARAAPALAGRALLALLEQPDVAEQAGQQRLVDAVRVGVVGGPADLDVHLLADLAQLGLEVLPLAHPQVVEELPLAHPAERRGGQLALLVLEVAPQVEPGEEVAALGLEAGVQLVGLRLLLGTVGARPLARVLQRQRGRDHDHLAHAAEPLGLEDHPRQPRVDRQPRQPAPDLGEPRTRWSSSRRGTRRRIETQGTELLEAAGCRR